MHVLKINVLFALASFTTFNSLKAM